MSSDNKTLRTVDHVELSRYVGKWYEIAAFPHRFEKGCQFTTAEYTLSEKGYIIVENRCKKEGLNGKESYIKGKAFVTENSGNAKLKVQFFWPFKAKYWIIDLAPDYSYAVVSHPNRKYLWILSRTPQIDKTILEGILKRAADQGLDISKLKYTVQK